MGSIREIDNSLIIQHPRFKTSIEDSTHTHITAEARRGGGDRHHIRIMGPVKLSMIDIVSFESKVNNLQELGEGGDGSEVGRCRENDGLLDLDHPGVPLLLVWLAYE